MAQRSAWLVWLSAAGTVLFGPGLIQQIQLAVRRHAVAQERARLEASHQALLEERQRLTSDPVYVEDRVRSTFKVAKPGELVVPLDSDEPSSASR